MGRSDHSQERRRSRRTHGEQAREDWDQEEESAAGRSGAKALEQEEGTGEEGYGQEAPVEKESGRWEVTIVRETVDESTIYVSGRSREEADEAADREFMEGGLFEFETIWSEYTMEVVKVDPAHKAYPVHWFPDQGPVCKVCLKTVVWTGIAADDPANWSGKSIPGPWVHAGSPSNESSS